MDTLLQDIRFGWRLLRRTPGFTDRGGAGAGAGRRRDHGDFHACSIASCCGRCPYRAARSSDDGLGDERREGADARAALAGQLRRLPRRCRRCSRTPPAWWYPQVNLTEAGTRPACASTRVEASGNFFAVLGVQPMLGAGFPAEPFYSRDGIAVISHRLWRERFGGDPAIVGKTDHAQRPARSPSPASCPRASSIRTTPTSGSACSGTSRSTAAARISWSRSFRLQAGRDDRAGEQRAARADDAAGRGEHVDQRRLARARRFRWRTEVVGFFRPALFALFGAAAFLLVITCTNVASLLLARATVREREVAVRAAIGASRGRLVRQFLTESVLLAVMGTALGVARGGRRR